MKRCMFCGRESSEDSQYCQYCGEALNQEKDTQDETPEVEVLDEEAKHNPQDIRCPNCGSERIALKTRESTGFEGTNACCGYILFGPLGLLCGLSGQRESLTVRKCQNCGHEF